MSQAITLQANLTVTCNSPDGPRITIPSGTVITFPDAVATQFSGGYIDGNGNFVGRNFATALCAAADMLKQAGGRAALEANKTEFDNQTIDGVDYYVTFGPDGQAHFDSQNVSPSASPSASPSTSVSASPSSSVSSSRSASPSAS